MENYVPFFIYMAIVVVAICLATSRKARYVFVAVVLCAIVFYGVLQLHGLARAESDIIDIQIDDYIIEPYDNTELKITFRFNGNYLSFYWEGKIDTSIPLKVTIWLPGLECIDANYIEGQPSG